MTSSGDVTILSVVDAGGLGSALWQAGLDQRGCSADPSEEHTVSQADPGAPSLHGKWRLATPARLVARHEREGATSLDITAGI